jgi:M6 family metalloprotease-like protein
MVPILTSAALTWLLFVPAGAQDISDFRTVETAQKTQITKTSEAAAGQAGFLGVILDPAKRDRPTILDMQSGSPAEKGGLAVGDQILKVESTDVRSTDVFREWLKSCTPGQNVKFVVQRKGRRINADITLGALSKPMSLDGPRALLGVSAGEEAPDGGVPIQRVSPFSPADSAGLRTGDVITKLDGAAVTSAAKIADIGQEKKPGESVVLTIRRGGMELDVTVKLGEDNTQRNANQQDNFARTPFNKPVFRLAIIPIEYPDVPHNEKIKASDWEESLFSTGTYKDKESVTGGPVYGSMNDYYNEMSLGTLRIEGKFFDWIKVSKNRGDYTSGTGTGGPNRLQLLTEALDLLSRRDGDNALEGYDGVFFIYAGGRFPTSRGGIYWPHRSTVSFKGRRLAYFIVQEGGSRMTNISVLCHEFGHMLGLPDLYARPENPGSEGLGNWCAMSNQVGNGRPQHFGAWCKEQMGWLKPAVIDPTVKQKLILAPVNGSSTECFKVLLRRDGSEYLLLENRKKTGFDASLPSEGLLIWRIVGRKVILEESHGVDGPAGPRVFTSAVPYPSSANDSYTPYTTPSSRSQLGGGMPVYITNIRRLPDGRITFYVGYEFD